MSQGQRNVAFERAMSPSSRLALQPPFSANATSENLEEQLASLKQQQQQQQHHRPPSMEFAAAAMPTPTPAPVVSPTFGPHQVPTTTTLSPQNPPFASPAASIASTIRRRQYKHTDSDAAVADLSTLPHEYIHTLVDLWFKENQPWLPILSRHSIQAALDSLPHPLTYIPDMVLKAVIAVQIAYSSQAIWLGYNGRYRLSQYLRSQVINEAFSKPSPNSLQALVVIAILDYGCDNIPSTFSLLSVCRRMCENIGLFRKLLNQMALQSPAQIGPPAVGSNTGDELAIPLTWAMLALDAVSTLGISWRDVSAALVDHLSSVAYISTPDLRDSYRNHIHLCAIGLQPLHNFIHEHEKGMYEGRIGDAYATCDEIYNNLMSYGRSESNSTHYTLLADGLIDFDPNLVLTSILAHASVIILYSRVVEFDCGAAKHTDTRDGHGNGSTNRGNRNENRNMNVNGSTSGGVPSEIPLQRCLQACEDIVYALRGISDADAELSSPLLVSVLFCAARFKLIAYRAMEVSREPLFDTLMHGINMCGRRWAVARRMDIVLRAAIVELDTTTPHSFTSNSANCHRGEGGGVPAPAPAQVPVNFWDVKKSHLDISEELKDWVDGYKHALYVGALNGPYSV
ncbi:hypothetical protein LTR99_003952 [Exophiala xenobiotica]|uniref:Xylanolytic transcriptional activator regulatory domain-containing protein n=1 Tax=Vermiconidia calcicola TaxID=1690605 RepID=A0AAV9PZ15_9PEZI|nr:hypothetical protein LTR99_003952 [Exophiala xenobiotica]KAK5529730.1 hypothetical protein LTR25_009509 [Vermiconidia calcicola]KAK5549066.1 hypothetical protein LTR23_000896 [Chaetothyriales sp. CCFEE 6169]KAK5435419.1 hypothetical protein LTR34_002923 [Exophiala xenobiotica]KAK5444699.1 hypothetical protein LTR18_004403 [Exophiala xenobiotica]